MSVTFEWTEIFRSVGIIWILWGLSTLALGRKVRQLARVPILGTLRQLWNEEFGAAYTLSYVFSFPIFMLLVCTVIQTSLVLVVKIGTMYACYAGARSAAVWLPAKPNVASQKIRLAAVQAFTPFAEGTPIHTKRQGITPTVTSAGTTYHQAYKRYAGDRFRAPVDYLARKYSFADQVLNVSWDPKDPVEDADVTVVVTYPMPLHIPGAARVLGHPKGVYPITSRAVLQNEGPKREKTFNPDRPLGIDYRSLP